MKDLTYEHEVYADQRGKIAAMVGIIFFVPKDVATTPADQNFQCRGYQFEVGEMKVLRATVSLWREHIPDMLP